MTNRKLIRYAIASEKIREVARAEGWGVGSPISYQAELADDYAHYAVNRSGLKNVGWNGCAYGCLASLIGGISGASVGAVFIANGDEHGLMTKVLFKAGAGIGGFIGGGFFSGALAFTKTYINEKTIENIIDERNKRRKERGIEGIKESQRKSAYGGLVASESDRFDAMTGNRFPKPSAEQLNEMSKEITDQIIRKQQNE